MDLNYKVIIIVKTCDLFINIRYVKANYHKVLLNKDISKEDERKLNENELKIKILRFNSESRKTKYRIIG